MGSAVFDSLDYFEKLKDAGFTEQQARVQANALREIIDDKLATKKDLVELEQQLTNEMQKLELRMTIKLGGMLVAAIAIIATLVKLL